MKGSGLTPSLEHHSVLRSLFETARRQGKKPQEFFLALLTKTTAQAQAALYRQPLGRQSRPPLRCWDKNLSQVASGTRAKPLPGATFEWLRLTLRLTRVEKRA